MALKEPHDDRCRDIIRKVCHDLDRATVISFPHDRIDIHFQDILVEDRDIGIR